MLTEFPARKPSDELVVECSAPDVAERRYPVSNFHKPRIYSCDLVEIDKAILEDVAVLGQMKHGVNPVPLYLLSRFRLQGNERNDRTNQPPLGLSISQSFEIRTAFVRLHVATIHCPFLSSNSRYGSPIAVKIVSVSLLRATKGPSRYTCGRISRMSPWLICSRGLS